MVAGVDKLIFLFKENEKIDVDNTSVSFVFGDSTPLPNTPCVIDPKIDYSSNTFTFNCGCNYITYDDNVFQQRCLPPDCSKDVYFDDTNKTSFTYNCLCDTKKDTNDFLVNCSTGGGSGGGNVDFGLVLNNYGFNSSTTFSLDFYNVESNYGFSSDASVIAADMRFPQQYEYGFSSDTVLYKYTMLDNAFTFGHQVNTLISFDDQNYFTTDISSYVSFESKTLVSFDDQNYFSTDINSYTSIQSDAIVVFNPYHEFNREITSHYGFSANVLMTYDVINTFGIIEFNYGQQLNSLVTFDNNKFEFEYNFNIGYVSNTLVSFDDVNKFNSDIDNNYGYESTALVIYGNPNPFELPFIGGMGYSVNSLVTFGEPNPFPTVITSDYGFSSSFVLNTKLYEDLTDFNKTFDLGYGHSANTFVIFNSYNPILKDTDTANSQYGYSVSSSMRYSDDPYINNVNFELGYSSSSELDIQVGLYTFAVDFNYGFDYKPNLEYTVGIAATGYYGINAILLYVANLHTPVYLDATMRHGYMMNYNEYDVRVLDLMKKSCCSFHKTDLKRIEMMDEPNYVRQYSDVDSFGIKVECVLRTEPRFAATISTGMRSDIIDPSVYLSAVFNHGVTANVRTMNFDTNIDLVGGNFIVDQNEIKVEMTKPDDLPSSLYGMSYGFLSRSDLSTERAYVLTSQQGYNSTFSLYFESPLRGDMGYGFQSQATLATFMIFSGSMIHGTTANATLYEPPYTMNYGFSMNVSQLFTENFVEFLEDGELQSEYIHQNKNGDPDLTKPNGISIEGYIYTHYVKGRCF